MEPTLHPQTETKNTNGEYDIGEDQVPIPSNPHWRYYPQFARTPSPRSMPKGVTWPPSPLAFGPLTPRQFAGRVTPKCSSSAFGNARFLPPPGQVQGPVGRALPNGEMIPLTPPTPMNRRNFGDALRNMFDEPADGDDKFKTPPRTTSISPGFKTPEVYPKSSPKSDVA